MTGPDLRSFVARSRALVDATPPTTARETRAWLVEPFLETLGWTVRDDAVATDATVEDARLEYVLAVDSVPALFVAVEPLGDDLEEERAQSLLEAMAWTGVDRAIYTNGRKYVLLAGTTSVEHLVCRLPSLPEHDASIEGYSRAAATRRLEPASQAAVARRLAVNRSAVVESIVEQLTAVAGDASVDAFETAADRFLDRLVVSFAENDADRFESASDDVAFRFTDPTSSGSGSRSSPDAASSSDTESATQTSAPASSDESRTRSRGETSDAATADSEQGADAAAEPDGSSAESQSRSGARPESDQTAANADADPAADDGAGPSDEPGDPHDPDRNSERDTAADGARGESDGEYVARFFNERGSIGAVGDSRSEQTLVVVAEYLFDRGLSGISVPWSPDDDDAPTLLNDEPVRATGEPMAAPRELSNGLYLETGGDAATHAQVAQALASRAGLRVMLTGDWE